MSKRAGPGQIFNGLGLARLGMNTEFTGNSPIMGNLPTAAAKRNE